MGTLFKYNIQYIPSKNRKAMKTDFPYFLPPNKGIFIEKWECAFCVFVCVWRNGRGHKTFESQMNRSPIMARHYQDLFAFYYSYTYTILLWINVCTHILLKTTTDWFRFDCSVHSIYINYILLTVDIVQPFILFSVFH